MNKKQIYNILLYVIIFSYSIFGILKLGWDVFLLIFAFWIDFFFEGLFTSIKIFFYMRDKDLKGIDNGSLYFTSIQHLIFGIFTFIFIAFTFLILIFIVFCNYSFLGNGVDMEFLKVLEIFYSSFKLGFVLVIPRLFDLVAFIIGKVYLNVKDYSELGLEYMKKFIVFSIFIVFGFFANLGLLIIAFKLIIDILFEIYSHINFNKENEIQTK